MERENQGARTTCLTKRQREGIFILEHNANLDSYNPRDRGGQDEEEQPKEWFYSSCRHPTGQPQRAAPSPNMRRGTYHILANHDRWGKT